MCGSWRRIEFPNLTASDYKKTSDATEDYNCISWAVGDVSKRWDPDDMNQHYWPPMVPRKGTMLAVMKAMQTVGYEPCRDSSLEEGFEKIAMYAIGGNFSHVARQLENGNWTSKLGDYEDVEHKNLECLNGESTDIYGHTVGYGCSELYMRRPIRTSFSQ